MTSGAVVTAPPGSNAAEPEIDHAGRVTGIRFYKGPGSTGTHVGSLCDASGDLPAR